MTEWVVFRRRPFAARFESMWFPGKNAEVFWQGRGAMMAHPAGGPSSWARDSEGAMAFQDDVGNLLVRAHLSEVPKPAIYGAALVFVLAIALIAGHFLGIFAEPVAVVSAGDGEAAQVGPETGGSGSASGEEADAGVHVTEPAVVIVHVAGAVMEPGVYPVAEGSRVEAAVKAAGGLSPQACPEAVNLARVVADGEQVYVPTVEEVESGSAPPGAAGAAGGAAGAVGAGSASKVNINTADAAGLDALPGVGPATAQRIVADREANGPFTSPEDIMRVSGIGQKKFEQMASMIAV